jgi:hypothetical protein
VTAGSSFFGWVFHFFLTGSAGPRILPSRPRYWDRTALLPQRISSQRLKKHACYVNMQTS